MRPYVLMGHSRPLTQVVYNREGDLIFTTGKDNVANIWYSSNGERLGSLGNADSTNKYPGQHRSAVWSIDVKWDTTEAATASADQTVKLWDVSCGKNTRTFEFESTTRCVNYSTDGNVFCVTQDRQMSAFNKVFVVDKRVSENNGTIASWKLSKEMQMGTRCIFGSMDQYIITAEESGKIRKWDWQNIYKDGDDVGEPVAEVQGHTKRIQDLKLNKDRTQAITASKDKTAKIWDIASYDTIEELKCIKHPTNCNTAAFNPTKPHVACGGGQEAMDVTTTAASQGYFECFIYNMITEDKVAMFKGHFGPINHLAFSPDGSQICTGGEEGYIRLNHLDPSYTNYRDIDLELGTPGQLVSAL